MKNSNLYNKEINFIDVLLIMKQYVVLIVGITILFPSVFFVYQSYLNTQQDDDIEYNATIEIYSYPLINTDKVPSFLPDIEMYKRYMSGISISPIVDDTLNSSNAFTVLKDILNIGDLIPLLELFLGLPYERELEFANEGFTFTYKKLQFEGIAESIFLPSGLLVSAHGKDPEKLKLYLETKIENAIDGVTRHMKSQFDSKIENIELQNEIIIQNYEELYLSKIAYLKQQLKIAEENSLETFDYVKGLPDFYKGIHYLKAEISDLKDRTSSSTQAPEVITNRIVINKLKNFDIYKDLQSNDPSQLFIFDLNKTIVKKVLQETNKLISIASVILFSFAFSVFLSLVLFSVKKFQYNRE